MTAVLRYLSHPQVIVDPTLPVPRWSLSDTGRGRMLALCGADWLAATTTILTSSETKACETAAILAAATGITPVIDAELDEIDRSATGYVPETRHDALADAFFARPDQNASGWETATDVATRGMRALHRHLARHAEGDLLIVGHGGIGTLIWCAIAGLAPNRRHDQPDGGGAIWAASLPDLAPLHCWRPAEAVAGLPARC